MENHKLAHCIYTIIAVLLPLVFGFIGGSALGLFGAVVSFLIECYAPYLILHIKFKDDDKTPKLDYYVIGYLLIVGIIDLIMIF